MDEARTYKVVVLGTVVWTGDMESCLWVADSQRAISLGWAVEVVRA